jgi:hypothetical protein
MLLTFLLVSSLSFSISRRVLLLDVRSGVSDGMVEVSISRRALLLDVRSGISNGMVESGGKDEF